MKLYQENGYVDISSIVNRGLPFNFVVGGRGTGKTYNALTYCLDNDVKFIFMRRTQSQCDLISKPQFSPFKTICRDRHISIVTGSISKYNSAFFYETFEDDEGSSKGLPIGYTAALSTISNIRGFDASDVDLLIMDEFIPERHERPIKNEFDAFLNAYETINRNRELSGSRPLQALCLSNANDIANPYFIGFNLVQRAVRMMEKNISVWTDTERGIGLYFLQESIISEAKSATALYRASKGSSFAEMSLGNKFVANEFGRIGSKPLREYIPIVSIGELCIYKHKSNGEYYASCHKMGSPPEFSTGDTERKRFQRVYAWLWGQYMSNRIVFEEYLCEVLFNKYFS